MLNKSGIFMKIVACVSHVPDTATRIKIGADSKSIDKTGVSFVINPYDEFAVEEALRTKQKFGGEVIAVSVGNDANKDTLKKSLAMGCDKGILIKTDKNPDSLTIAEFLCEEIKKINPDIVFFGKQSVDFDSSAVGLMFAELSGFTAIGTVVKLEINGTDVIAEREIEGGREIVKASLPVVITCQKGLNEPRFPSLKNIMQAKTKPIEEKPAADISNKVEITSMNLPPSKQKGKILAMSNDAIPQLVQLLRQDAKVI